MTEAAVVTAGVALVVAHLCATQHWLDFIHRLAVFAGYLRQLAPI